MEAGTGYASKQNKAALKWFSKSEEKRGSVPDAITSLDSLSGSEVKSVGKKLWASYKKGAKALGWDKEIPKLPTVLEKLQKQKKKLKFRPKTMSLGDGKKMKFYTLLRGKAGKGGWPMHITLHGGGRSSTRVKPHGSPINNREWEVQGILFERVFKNSGIYYIPRIADDNDGRWWYRYNHEAFDKMIRRGILFNGVDANRVYIYGISEGGYGTCRIGPLMADRFGAVGAMAAAGRTDINPLENLRNTPFRIDMGENDTAYGRARMAGEWGQAMKVLKDGDKGSGAYRYHVEMHKGRGHGINYGPQPRWLTQHVRDPYPEHIVWTVSDVHGHFNQDFYNLSYEKEPAAGHRFYFTAKFDKQKNKVVLTAEQDKKIETGEKDDKGNVKTKMVREAFKNNTINVHLNDRILDLDKVVTVELNGKAVFKGKVKRLAENMMRSISDRGDPYFVFPGMIKVDVK